MQRCVRYPLGLCTFLTSNSSPNVAFSRHLEISSLLVVVVFILSASVSGDAWRSLLLLSYDL